MDTSKKSAKIPLGRSGRFAIVDFEDLERISQYSWSCFRSGRNFYAVHSRKKTKTKPAFSVAMHRLVLGIEKAGRSVVVDHVNGNGLDNRKDNLRICSQQQNLFNQGRRKNSQSRFKGVYVRPGDKKWSAKIPINGKLTHIGSFASAEAAARAYDRVAIETRGTFAFLNFPEDITRKRSA